VTVGRHMMTSRMWFGRADTGRHFLVHAEFQVERSMGTALRILRKTTSMNVVCIGLFQIQVVCVARKGDQVVSEV
jgi:hypothetical protein